MPTTYEVTYTEVTTRTKVVTVDVPAPSETGQSMAMDRVRAEDPRRVVLHAKAVTGA